MLERRLWCGPWRLVRGRWERTYVVNLFASGKYQMATHYGPRVDAR